jgi:hypothetical protein
VFCDARVADSVNPRRADHATAVPASAEFATKNNEIVTKRKTGSDSLRRRAEFASEVPHFDSGFLNSSGLSAKK